MTVQQIAIVVIIVVIAVLGLVLYSYLLKDIAAYEALLPTLEEARESVKIEYPEYSDSFVPITIRVPDYAPGTWIACPDTYISFLECEEIGVRIRIKLISD